MSFNNLLVRGFERFRGTSIIRYTSKLLEMDFYSRPDLDKHVKEKWTSLRAVLKSNVWYVNFLKEKGINEFPESIEEFPILSKDDLRDYYAYIRNNPPKGKYNLVRSGGTTGNPVQLFMSYESRSWAGAALYRYYSWWNMKFGTRIGILWGSQSEAGASKFTKNWKKLKNRVSNRLLLNTFFIDDKILLGHYQSLSKFNPVVLRGYANSLYEFALYIKSRNLPVWSNLKTISTTSEKMTIQMQALIEETFKVPVTNQYGCGEVNGIAFECPEGRQMHIAEEHAIIEVVDEKNKGIKETSGRLLITDLDNYVTPVVRYEVGDFGVISDSECICGREHMILTEITGRLSEALILGNERKIAPSYWSVLLRPYVEITQACVRVISPFHLQIDLILNQQLNEETLSFLKSSVVNAVGENITVEWRSVNRIPTVKSGKKPWVRKVDEEIEIEQKVTEI